MEETKCYCGHTTYCDCGPEQETLTYSDALKKEERIFNSTMMFKQETLYEAFLNCLINKEFKTKEDYIAFKGAEFGAKWQQERSYSEEEVGEILYKAFGECGKHYSLMLDGAFIDRLFKQFKKK